MNIYISKKGYFYKLIENKSIRISKKEYLIFKNKIECLSNKINFSVNENINYLDNNGNKINAIITYINTNVNYGEEPDITIKFDNGNERQTLLNRIIKKK